MVQLFRTFAHKIGSSLRNKLIVIFIGVIILPLMVSIYISYERFTAELRKVYISSNTNLLGQVNSRLDDYFKQLNDITIALNDEKDLFGLSNDSDPKDSVSDQTKYQRRFLILNNIFTQRKDINSILFYYPITKELFIRDRNFYQSFIQNATDIEKTQWYRELIDGKRNFFVDPTHQQQGYRKEYGLNSNTPVFSVNRSYQMYLNSRISGVLSMNFDLSNIRLVCNSGLQGEMEQIAYLDKAGALFYTTVPSESSQWKPDFMEQIQAEKDSSGSLEYRNGEEKWLLVYSKSQTSGSLLCKFIPLEVVYRQAYTTRNINMFISVFIILALVIASVVISYRITNPLSRLEKNMEKAGRGNFDSPVPITTSDEIGKMSGAFNTMISEINQLINEKYKMKLVNRLAQLKALQAQINPHFLNNTLQAIGSVALEKGLKDLYKMTTALSNMLRYSIKTGGNVVTVGDELLNVQDYLSLQKFRYEDKLEYTVDVPADLLPLRIPKLIFQPIVENAIIHGIEPMKEPGRVRIRCRQAEETLEIAISDNGIGMREPELAALRSRISELQEETVDTGDKIGILNVLHRLRLMMGGDCTMTVDSSPDTGTCVQLHIPLNKNMEW